MVQVVNAVLAEVDGVGGRDGVILLAACNHPHKLDPALVRSGRLDRHIRISLPDRAALVRILREHLGADLEGEDLSRAALFAAGASGADCERFVRGARRRAREVARPMSVADLLAEIRWRDAQLSEADLWLSAVHEAGHAVATCVLRPGSVRSVSVIGDELFAGGAGVSLATSCFLRVPDIRERLVILLAGRAAEEEVLGEASSAAGGQGRSDLAIATELSVMAEIALGLDPVAGLLWRGMPGVEGLQHALTADPGLACRIRETLDDAYKEARRLVSAHVGAVRGVAEALVSQRALDAAQVEAIARRSTSSATRPRSG